jgi:hypothetical protein
MTHDFMILQPGFPSSMIPRFNRSEPMMRAGVSPRKQQVISLVALLILRQVFRSSFFLFDCSLQTPNLSFLASYATCAQCFFISKFPHRFSLYPAYVGLSKPFFARCEQSNRVRVCRGHRPRCEADAKLANERIFDTRFRPRNTQEPRSRRLRYLAIATVC